MENTTPVLVPSLANVLDKQITPTAWVEFREGIAFQLAFLPKGKFRSLADKHTEMIYDSQLKARKPKLNTESFTLDFVKTVVKDWRGVTLQSLSQIAPVDVAGYSEEELKQPLPYNPGQLVKLIDGAYDLDGFINEAVMDIRTFRPSLEAEAKN